MLSGITCFNDVGFKASSVFNLIPFGPFDGAKILRWDKRAWFAALAAGIGLFAMEYFVLQIATQVASQDVLLLCRQILHGAVRAILKPS